MLKFYGEFDEPAGNLRIEFSDPPMYQFYFCMAGTTPFSIENNKCSNDEKMWEISMTRDTDPNILIKCDETMLLDMELSSGCMTWSSSKTYWDIPVRKIKFHAYQAPDFWRTKKGSTSKIS